MTTVIPTLIRDRNQDRSFLSVKQEAHKATQISPLPSGPFSDLSY